jgi:prepilin-type N-terminal cleavage/methylation domain-containing protein
MKASEKGFTLIEMMIALTITVLVVVSSSIAGYQILGKTERNSNRMTAVLQVQNAGYWINRDTLMAQRVVTGNLSSQAWLQLNWTEADSGDEWQIVYSLENMDDTELKALIRRQSVNGVNNGSMRIAEYIEANPARTGCEFDNGVLSFTITVIAGSGLQIESETRTYQIVQRSGLN